METKKMIVKAYKLKKRIICYIQQEKDKFFVCTGKPSDVSCLSWQYENLTDAEKTAEEYFRNYTNF